jgi:hypothetical protein
LRAALKAGHAIDDFVISNVGLSKSISRSKQTKQA